MDKGKLDQGSIEKLISSWAEKTSEQEEEQSPIPIKVLLGEAVDLASLVDSHFEPRRLKSRDLPGLGAVAGTGAVGASSSREIRELGLVISSVHARITVLIEKPDQEPIERGNSWRRSC
ncbi:MAG TPA: hypothetical protein VLC09_02900, partial [Polyangiaceae bacterium]|nr:hypothetical protein [Polyangiaceae bacterium]